MVNPSGDLIALLGIAGFDRRGPAFSIFLLRSPKADRPLDNNEKKRGSTYSPVSVPTEAAMFAIWDRALTLGEMSEVYAWTKAKLGGSISIT
jgi:hypothetical protein